MAAEDDMFVVIIGDDDEEEMRYKVPAAIMIKEEVLELEDGNEMKVEHLLEAAEKHGRQLTLADVGLSDQLEETTDFQYLDEDELDSDGIVLPDEGDEFYSNEIPNISIDFEPVHNISARRRVKMLDPSERRSFVAALRKQKPYFYKNQEALVEHLYLIMKSVKAPEPVPDFYRVHDLQYECIVCEALFNNVMTVTRHYQEKHGPRYLFCYACGVDFRSITNLYKHEKRCRAPDCAIVLRARARMVGLKGRARPFLLPRDQVVKVETPKRFPCPQCPAVYMTRTGLVAHELLHRGLRPFVCAQCQQAYTSRSALSRHEQLHTDIKFQCDLCGRQFRIKSALVSHMDVHLPEKKHLCPHECGRRFATRTALSAHVRGRHLRLPPPCACRLCPKRFPRNSLLKVHMKKAHDMILMTRKMFFKTLPKMKSTQVEQARIFFRHDQPESPWIPDDLTDENYFPDQPNRNEVKPTNETDNSVIVVENGEFTTVVETSEHREKYDTLREEYERLIAEVTGVGHLDDTDGNGNVTDENDTVSDGNEIVTDGNEDVESNENVIDISEDTRDGTDGNVVDISGDNGDGTDENEHVGNENDADDNEHEDSAANVTDGNVLDVSGDTGDGSDENEHDGNENDADDNEHEDSTANVTDGNVVDISGDTGDGTDENEHDGNENDADDNEHEDSTANVTDGNVVDISGDPGDGTDENEHDGNENDADDGEHKDSTAYVTDGNENVAEINDNIDRQVSGTVRNKCVYRTRQNHTRQFVVTVEVDNTCNIVMTSQ